jgi:hypothetical protein
MKAKKERPCGLPWGVASVAPLQGSRTSVQGYCSPVHLLYVDESGKSGPRDPRQPAYILAGVIVSEAQWRDVEVDLAARVDLICLPPRPANWEIHAADIAHGKRFAKGLSGNDKRALIEAVLSVIDAFDLRLEFVVIDKMAHLRKYANPLPYEVLAYRFMIERFEYFLGNHHDQPLGMVVSDDQKGQEETIRAAHSELRKKGSTYSQIDRIVETPFFAPSHASCMLQIADVCAYQCNRLLRAERAGLPVPGEWMRLVPHIDHIPGRGYVGFKSFPKP